MCSHIQHLLHENGGAPSGGPEPDYAQSLTFLEWWCPPGPWLLVAIEDRRGTKRDIHIEARTFRVGEEADMIQTLGWLPLVVGLAVATISAALAIKWLVSYLTRHGLAIFGWYRLAIAALVAVLIYTGRLGL